jgi:hypothetical protein
MKELHHYVVEEEARDHARKAKTKVINLDDK